MTLTPEVMKSMLFAVRYGTTKIPYTDYMKRPLKISEKQKNRQGRRKK